MFRALEDQTFCIGTGDPARNNPVIPELTSERLESLLIFWPVWVLEQLL